MDVRKPAGTQEIIKNWDVRLMSGSRGVVILINKVTQTGKHKNKHKER